jgi:hypothetical protein
MNAHVSKFVIIGAFFVVIFLFGFWVSRTGRPYNAALFNVHKLIALATGVYLIVTVVRAGKVSPLNGGEIAALVVTALFFVGLMVTGGLMSIDATGGLAKASQQVRDLLPRVHSVLPYLAVLSTAASLFLMLGKR